MAPKPNFKRGFLSVPSFLLSVSRSSSSSSRSSSSNCVSSETISCFAVFRKLLHSIKYHLSFYSYSPLSFSPSFTLTPLLLRFLPFPLFSQSLHLLFLPLPFIPSLYLSLTPLFVLFFSYSLSPLSCLFPPSLLPLPLTLFLRLLDLLFFFPLSLGND